jgi:hypothetical protein
VCICEKKCRMVWLHDDYYDREHRAYHQAELGKVVIFFLLTLLVLFP